MRKRVAAVATLGFLAVLALLFAYNCSRLAGAANQDLSEQIETVCSLTGQMSRSDAVDARVQTLEELHLKGSLALGLYNADGSAVYRSKGSDALLAAELPAEAAASAAADGAVMLNLPDPQGRKAIYAIYQYEDGGFLLMGAHANNAWSEFAHNPMLAALLGMFILCVCMSVYMFSEAKRREKHVHDLMDALNRFAEGDFGARVDTESASDPRMAQYNAIIAMIQDRIFRQKSRNQVISTVMSQMQHGILAVDRNLHVIYVTAVAEKLLGIAGNAEGMSINDASRDVRLDEVFRAAMRQEGVYTNDVAARTAVGRGHRPLRLYVSRMMQDGQVVGAMAIVEDVTELRRLEEVRTDFVANVSHELKTPLTSIRGFVETLQAGAIDNPEMARKFLNIITVETERLTRLINDILSISKLESGDSEVTTERIRLDKKCCEVCDILIPQAQEKQVTLNYHMNDEPVYIIGNPDRVHQLLMNLTENAIKYNVPGGSVTVQVFANGQEANITISDTGIGIAEENLPRLFERFYRVDKGRSRQMGGTGLGLAIVKHIVKSMGGEIEVHSKLNEGTEFLITLPLAPEEKKETIFGDM